MTWTYNPAGLASSKMMQVRYLVGDTIATDKQIQDEEIAFALTIRTSIWGGAAMVCRSLAARLSREADTVDKDLRTTLSARASSYARRANDYENKALTRSGALPYAGGISIDDKIMNEMDGDRVAPQFTLSMDDNYEPVSPIGNEGTPAPTGFTDDFDG